MKSKETLQNVINIFFPNGCVGCNTPLSSQRDILCNFCHYDLHHTSTLEVLSNNEIHKRVCSSKLKYAYAYLHYDKSALAQSIMYNFKYRGLQQIGTLLGKKIGATIKNSKLAQCDAIIPVPLHKRKEKKRGFNQSAVLAKAIAKELRLPILKKAVRRTRNNKSQARLSSQKSRSKNTEDLFECTPKELLPYQHLIIIDDIITTGSTSQEMLNCLHRKGITCQVSLICLGLSSS